MSGASSKERPIIFSSPMVRAILDGRKTQTRRVVKPQPKAERVNFAPIYLGPDVQNDPTPFLVWQDHPQSYFKVPCPFGQPGDRLWVRETWRVAGGREYEYQQMPEAVMFRADGHLLDHDWRPSIYMPRWASRLTVVVVSVRVERVREISEEDAKAEGVEPYGGISPGQRIPGEGFNDARLGDEPHRLPFADLWDSINAKRGFGWDSNSWVWVVEFRRVS